jgi:biopolymer transport protein ExbD
MGLNRKKLNSIPKLNLIPILDAIFIFIFFLLMSAQFIDIYELDSDAPITSTTDQLPPDKKPLNLTVELSKNKIVIKTGIDGIIHKTVNFKNLSEYNKTLRELKKQYPKENSAILKPARHFQYENIVKVIDQTRSITEQNVFITAVDNQNRKYPSKVLFDKIIFETQE